ncbi:unnamed protein product [Discosporangium mesarthrocarpum]
MWVKTTFTDKQRVDRVGFVLNHLHSRSGSGLLVDDLFNWVHVDEKWFYLMKDGKFYLQPDEEVPKPARASNKRSILKMMFLAPVARPRKLTNGVWFDGKVGIWPIVDVVTARQQKPCQGRPCPQTSHGGRGKVREDIDR